MRTRKRHIQPGGNKGRLGRQLPCLLPCLASFQVPITPGLPFCEKSNVSGSCSTPAMYVHQAHIRSILLPSTPGVEIKICDCHSPGPVKYSILSSPTAAVPQSSSLRYLLQIHTIIFCPEPDASVGASVISCHQLIHRPL